MSIGVKIMIAILATTVILSGAIYGFSKITFAKSFADLETKNVSGNVTRIASAYDTMLNDLDRFNHDWAAWDDTYNFVQTPSDAYITSNPTDTTFINAKLNYLLILNNSGKVVYGKGFNLEEQQEIPIPSDVEEKMTGNDILSHIGLTSNMAGMILLPQNPLMFSAQPIVTSQGTGPVVGTIIMARYIDSRVAESLKETTHLPIILNNIPDPGSSSEIQTAYTHLIKDNPVFVQPLSEQSIAGYTLIKDVFGNPALIIKTEMPRDIYLQGQTTMEYYRWVVLLFSVLFILTTMLLINSLVTRRLKVLSKNVNSIHKTKNLSDRVKVSGNDELSSLGTNINEMLSTIQTTQDLLQKKHREEEVLRLTIESVADGLITFDVNGTIRQVNDAAAKMQGCARKEDIVGRSFRDFIAEEDQIRFSRLLHKTVQGEDCGTTEFTLITKDGMSFPVEMSVALLRDTAGQVVGIIAATRNISERKVIEQMLFENEQKFRLLVENQSDLVIATNKRSELLFVNPAYCKLMGKEKDQLLGTSIVSQVHSHDRDQVVKILESINQSSHPGYSEQRWVLGKEMRWLAWKYNAVLDDQGNVTSITGSGRDITESKLAKEELEKANAQLKELDQMKDNLLSTVSHELRTPLTSIKSFTEILLTYDEGRETQRQFLGIINEESDRLTRLINDFLDLSKIQAGKMQWKTVELSVVEIINSAVLSARPLLEKAKLALKLDIEPDLPHVMSDRDKLIQVFTNIMGNAVKFTREGGSISLKAGPGLGGNREDRQWLTVSISDTGIGISPENHSKIFENFGQVGDVLKDRPKGTGLGLSICKKIIENYGGKIWVESVLGQGTTFLFSLPMAKKNIEAIKPPEKSLVTPALAAPQETSGLQAKTILVVDDEANIRCFIDHELTRHGYQVIQAGGGREALDLARKYHPDLITLDISMPDLNGLDVTAIIKNDPDTRDIPILIISVMEEQQRALQLGANDYINKPASMELIIQRVNSLLGSSQKIVLVVDDDEALTLSLEYELGKGGFKVKTANSGKQALAYLEHSHPDLMLLDLKMPEMDGFEVMKVLKNRPDLAGIPVVILTGMDVDRGKSEALSRGAADYFNKSEKHESLIAAIDRILNRKIKQKERGDLNSEKQMVLLVS
jgi:PAS domain S-box-containing protein